MFHQLDTYYPAEELWPYVEAYWFGLFNQGQQAALEQEVMPNGFAELIVHLDDRHCMLREDGTWCYSPDYMVIGKVDRRYEVLFDARVPVFGIRLKPEGIFHLFGVPLTEFINEHYDASGVFGRSFATFCHQLRECSDTLAMTHFANDYLKRRTAGQHPEITYLTNAVRIIRESNGTLRVDDLAKRVYVSRRQLERAFVRFLGTTPKQYMRVIRLNAANRQLIMGTYHVLTGVAYDNNYADQAHFIREFRHYSGVTPARFLSRREDYIVNV